MRTKTPRKQALVRLSATVDPYTFERAKQIADASGFRFSFSAYLSQLMERDIQERSRLFTAPVSR